MAPEKEDWAGEAAKDLQGLRIEDEGTLKSEEVHANVLPATPPPTEPISEGDKLYVDPTPKTPAISRHPSQRVPENEYNEKDGSYGSSTSDAVEEEKAVTGDMQESTSEIQSIMEQFTDGEHAPTEEEIMSPRHEMAGPILGGSGTFPERKSSLEPLRSRDMDGIASSPIATEKQPFSPISSPPVPPKPDFDGMKSPPLHALQSTSTTSLSHQPPPPEPEPDLPFDFHRFLEQLRHKSADPVAKYLRSFLNEFGKKQWMVHEQVKLIQDFLAFITNKMAQCDVWREVSDVEFDNAKEGMEKLVMNRLYSQTFSPAIPQPVQTVRARARRKEQSSGTGRRGQHQEDVERDDILSQKIRIYSWIREEHLDIPPVGPNGERFLRLAQQELLKIKGYRAPRDKVICVLNSCKVIFGLLKNTKSSDLSADSFVPLLIYTVLKANPEHLVSNIQYILRFRNQDKLGGEAGYYLSSLSGAIQFIEGLDRTTLTVSDEEFEKNVEIAVSEIAEQYRQGDSPVLQQSVDIPETTELSPARSPAARAPSTSPRKNRTLLNNSSLDPDTSVDEGPAAGLLRTIQRPLSTIGRIFSDQDTTQESRVTATGQNAGARLSPALFQPPRSSSEERREQASPKPQAVPAYDAQEAAARQASAEAAEARKIQRAEHRNVVETLCGMFPNLDKEVIDDVVRQKQGRVGLAVDACLALTAGG